MCNVVEYRYNCLIKKYVYKSDIRKCFQIGPDKAKKVFDLAMEDTAKDGKRSIDADRVHFKRVLKVIGMTEKEIIDDHRNLQE